MALWTFALCGAGGAKVLGKSTASKTQALWDGIVDRDIAAVEGALDAGADVSLPNHVGDTALHLALATFDADIFALLLARAASLETRDARGQACAPTPIEKVGSSCSWCPIFIAPASPAEGQGACWRCGADAAAPSSSGL